ncbi:hypothetical protein PSA7680_00777 [Pseudoruegeria aquimaris]|uniref:Tellurite resistance protein TrgA n=1 Tax=Pseudoruegeria aquimaris TaxID=393663 RepID=A0A1Y5RMJ6_9RHOB|nr:TrgA family protein [Pseudoruegeria aquimaris]SLN20962.1 hypothetical protein PSA7680_00777 [Pseudoruegeria aquimaris]
MPTAAKLVASIAFALLAYFTSELVKPLLDEGTPTKWFSEGNTLIGLICGWKIMGPRGGEGTRAAIGVGLTTSAAMTAVAIFLHASIEMVKLSMRKSYDGPVEAVAAVFEISFEHALLIANPTILGTLAIGGIFCGFISNWAGRNWR